MYHIGLHTSDSIMVDLTYNLTLNNLEFLNLAELHKNRVRQDTCSCQANEYLGQILER